MSISYHLVRYWMRDLTMVQRVEPQHIVAGTHLRRWSNQLVEETERLLSRLPLSQLGVGHKEARWSTYTFKPIVQQLRRDIPLQAQRLDPAILAELGCYRRLLRTLDRLSAAAAHPQDRVLRRIALREVIETVQDIEDYLKQHGLAAYLSETPRTLTPLQRLLKRAEPA